MKRSPREAKNEHALDLTPAIDVVFLLLIFFISTIQLPDPESDIKAYLPKTHEAKSSQERPEDEEEDVDRVRITIEADPILSFRIRLNGAALGGFEELAAMLDTLKATTESDAAVVRTEVVLDIDSSVPYRHVVQTLDTCNTAGYTNCTFALPATPK
jgi:biopolymer transport protein ExbD